MARIIIVPDYHEPEGASSKFYGLGVVEPLERLGHKVELHPISDKVPLRRKTKAAEAIREAQGGDEKEELDEKSAYLAELARKNADALILVFHASLPSYPYPEKEEIPGHLRLVEEKFGGMCPMFKTPACWGSTGKFPVVTVMRHYDYFRRSVADESKMPPKNLVAIEVSALFKPKPKKTGLGGWGGIDEKATEKAGLFSSEIVQHIARGVHAIASGAQVIDEKE